jgi:hypothetical protein
MNIHQAAANEAKDQGSNEFSDRRLWTAVLLQALEDWKSPNRRRQMEADEFFFQSGPDFARVCMAAGLKPESVLVKLQRMKDTVRPAVQLPYAA